MFNRLPTAILASALLFGAIGDTAIAKTCVAGVNCPPPPIQFIPGESITVELVNLTAGLVEIQHLNATDPLAVSPGQILTFNRVGGTKPNFSVVFWDAIGLPLQVRVLKPEAKVLRIEVRPGGRPPGDRSVYIKNDGRVNIL